MLQNLQPIIKDLVLIGGGHSHVIAMRMFAMNKLPGVRLTLITESSYTPYSGMLPGHIAGFYSYDECHIDLRPLAEFAGAQLYVDRVIGLDLENQQILCANRPSVSFDVLSIDIGSTPATISVPGATEYAIPAKPVPQLLEHWWKMCQELEVGSNTDGIEKNQSRTNQTDINKKSTNISIIGGGAGGVELALSMHGYFNQLQIPYLQNIHLFQRSPELMPNHHPSVRRLVEKILRRKGIQLHLGENVCQVKPHNLQTKTSTKKNEQEVTNTEIEKFNIICESGLTIECDRVFWVTQASAPQWLKAAGLKTDEQGFILVNDYLQSLTHPQIFAAGDIATMINHPRPKAGVFAVRQGRPLFENLQRFLLGQSLKLFQPQQQYLSLIGTGDERAIATRGFLTLPPHKLLWRWKDYIDRKFMDRFNKLPEMRMENQKSVINPFPSSKLNSNPTMHCAGCGSKIGGKVLEKVLHRIRVEQPYQEKRDDIIIGLDAPDDAAVIQIASRKAMVQSIDYFRSLIDDPYIFGQIAGNHCLSDIFAMGAKPQSALAIATVPYGATAKIEETLYQLLSGAVKVLNQAQAPLIGGHTTGGAELGFGLSCNGLGVSEQLLCKSGMEPGQVLILTKAVGTGTLFAANMRHQAKGRWIDGAIESMLLSNQAAATCFLENGATACTDITGFGLLGHLVEMVKASQISIELQIDAIPILAGAQQTIAAGIISSLHTENLDAASQIQNLQSQNLQSQNLQSQNSQIQELENHPYYPLLFDPQTSGGLLASVPKEQANSCLNGLQTLGYKDSCIIGSVTPQTEENKAVRIIS
ncbi:selenide, water dikinase SelD [Mastigocoleus testarum]|uniref:Selenide, water dikinase n=1 Tax=Mastigocoleus testarum BC008 TaxID=371196 RepID=A0A0V7ZMW3_9CYAN|nr:selenide, water dikinase SelD [Mastigocoleus testarum]KST65891.1 selenide, water dikinase [Mastigocoleus testarum BC008]